MVSESNAFHPLHRVALRAFADFLWARYPLNSKTPRDGAIPAADADLSVLASLSERERELVWVQESFPHETANRVDVSYNHRSFAGSRTPVVEWPGDHRDPLLPVAIQAATLRQI